MPTRFREYRPAKKRGEAKRTQTPAGTAVNVRPRRSESDEEAHALPAESEVLFASPIGPFKKTEDFVDRLTAKPYSDFAFYLL